MPKAQIEIINQLDGEIIDAIDHVFKLEWWSHLDNNTQEYIRDRLFNVLENYEIKKIKEIKY